MKILKTQEELDQRVQERKIERSYTQGVIDGRKYEKRLGDLGMLNVEFYSGSGFFNLTMEEKGRVVEQYLEIFKEGYTFLQKINKESREMYNAELFSLMDGFTQAHERLCLSLYNPQISQYPQAKADPELLNWGEKPK